MMTASLDVRQWLSKTDKLRGIFRDKPALLKAAFSIAGFRDIQDHFRNEEGPSGRWQARKDSTQKSYAQRGKTNARYSPSNKILQLTGALRQSVMASTGTMRTLNANTIQVFANSNYGGVHDRGNAKMPKRSFMWLSKNALDQMNEIILKRLREI